MLPVGCRICRRPPQQAVRTNLNCFLHQAVALAGFGWLWGGSLKEQTAVQRGQSCNGTPAASRNFVDKAVLLFFALKLILSLRVWGRSPLENNKAALFAKFLLVVRPFPAEFRFALRCQGLAAASAALPPSISVARRARTSAHPGKTALFLAFPPAMGEREHVLQTRGKSKH